MTTIKEQGIILAEQALVFSIWYNTESGKTLVELRQAIRTLFGTGIEDALVEKWGENLDKPRKRE